MATKRTPTTPSQSRMTARKTEAPMVSKREAQPAKPTPSTPAPKEVAPQATGSLPTPAQSGRNAQGTTPPPAPTKSDRMAETVKNTGAQAVTNNGTGSPSKAAGNAASTDAVDDQVIAARAYEKFLARGGEHGYHIEDWLAAEAELRGSKS